MDKSSSFRRILRDVATKRTFPKLEGLCQPKVLQSMAGNERKELGLLLVKWGDALLKKGDQKALEIFNWAGKVAPHSIKILLEKAQSWLKSAKRSDLPGALEHAKKSFEAVLELQPQHFEALFGRAQVLSRIAERKLDYAHFLESFSCFDQALAFCPLRKKAEFFWQRGRSYAIFASFFGEAVDLQKALQNFQEALEHGQNSHLFYNDYAKACHDFAELIQEQDFFLSSLTLYQKAAALRPRNFLTQLNLAQMAAKLYFLQSSSKYLQLAQETFLKAAALKKTDVFLHLKWGEFLLQAAKRAQDLALLEQAHEKLEKALLYDKNNPLILSRLAECLLSFAQILHEESFLFEARTLLLKALVFDPKNQGALYTYSLCMIELGNLYEDESFYEKASDKMRLALSYDFEHPLAWYGLAQCHLAMGMHKMRAPLLKKALGGFLKASELSCDCPYLNLRWGIALLKLGEIELEAKYLEASLAKFDKSLKILDADIETLYHYACSLDLLGDLCEMELYYERAIQILSYILTIDGNYLPARYHLGLALSHLGEVNRQEECFIRANEYFKSLAKLDEEDDIAWNEWGCGLLNLARIALENAREETFFAYCEEAEQKLIKAASLGSTVAFYSLACSLAMRSCYDRALFFLEKAKSYAALPPIKEMINDEWLGALRQTKAFEDFLSTLKS